MRRSALAAAATALAFALAPAASADTVTSANWSGYAVHGRSFREVTARWREPNLTCFRGSHAYSSIWVGLGGFATNSSALEQLGTEVDCSLSGQTLTSVWYELVPAASQPIQMEVYPGDEISATVVVEGHLATLSLTDLSRSESFGKTVYARSVDVSSADWIVEAPSTCIGPSCQSLPLADFGPVHFSRALAIAANGTAGRISSAAWHVTRLVMAPKGSRFAATGSGTAAASPSALRSDGAAFTVRHTGLAAATRATRAFLRLLR